MEQQAEVIMIDTLDGFVKALHHWHHNKVQVIKHLQSIPEGTEVSKESEEPFVLTGDALKGFVMGLQVALEEIGELPFEAEIDFTSKEPPIKDSAGNTH